MSSADPRYRSIDRIADNAATPSETYSVNELSSTMTDLSSDAAQRLAETQDAITETQYVDDDEVEASVKRSFEQLRDAFAAFDADGDGKLTEDEVVAALTRKTGTELSEEAARATWKRWQYKYDLNNDGKISYEELVEATAD